MSGLYAATEAQILKAIDMLNAQQKPNLAKTAREFAVTEQRLQA